MIEINLLPENLKEKKGARNIDYRKILFFIPAIFAILLISHFYLLGVQIIRNARLGPLNKKWQQLAPQKKNLEAFQPQLSGSAKAIQELTAQRVNWANKLNKLSQYLPRGIWFTEMTVSGKDFNLKGAVISLEKQEMALINKFMDSLYSDAAFFKDFSKLELGSSQRKTIGGYDVAEFILTGNLK